MYKNQLQELAQRSCFNLPSYSCIREGPDHAPRFKATVNFNGETFESPQYCTTLRQAEHSAAEVALNALAGRGPSNSLAARVLDETGVYKNLLQEVSQRVGASLPTYSTFKSGLGHLPVFTCTVELARVIFTGEPAKNKKQSEKNAAMAAWTSLKLLVQQFETSTPERARSDEQEHVTVARALQRYLLQARINKVAFPIKFQTQNPRPPSIQQTPPASSKILPFICPRPNRSRPFVISSANTSSMSSKISPQSRPNNAAGNETTMSARPSQDQKSAVTLDDSLLSQVDNIKIRPQKFPAAGAAPYIPIRHFNPHHRFAPPVTIRNAIPVFSSPPPRVASLSPRITRPTSSGIPPPVLVRPPTPVLPPSVCLEQLPLLESTIQVAESPYSKAPSTKPDELLASKPADAPSENPPVAVSMSVIVDSPPASKSPPPSENPPVAVSMSVTVDPPPASKAPPLLPKESLPKDPPTSEGLPNPVEPS